MKRRGVPALALALLACALGVATTLSVRSDEPPVSLASLRAVLAAGGQRVDGRVLRLRGVVRSPSCLMAANVCLGLYQAADAADPLESADYLPLSLGKPDGWDAWLRGLPLLGTLAPAPQALRWQRLATYRIRLHAQGGAACRLLVCYSGEVLDAERGLRR